MSAVAAEITGELSSIALKCIREIMWVARYCRDDLLRAVNATATRVTNWDERDDEKLTRQPQLVHCLAIHTFVSSLKTLETIHRRERSPQPVHAVKVIHSSIYSEMWLIMDWQLQTIVCMSMILKPKLTVPNYQNSFQLVHETRNSHTDQKLPSLKLRSSAAGSVPSLMKGSVPSS